MSELLPCPFCGSDDVQLEYARKAQFWVYWIECNGCGCEGPIEITGDNVDALNTPEDAARAWNERVENSSQVTDPDRR